ncbi:membrane protein [Tamlana nanhaiensis]|uniref:Membrane protein n=1 Tax=Neotamlana nanhaiensis TaxID=1382798 RepID=A0A0D7W535_9FLAO|nr:DUF3667 domain-containing protein [Tamlana nanhaiensis]KJD32922.1 membrane protein [Tamlana nanhaiensis]
MSELLETCKNCEKVFYSAYKFCPHCGQQARDKLTVGVLFANTIQNYFAFDARFFKSFFPLLFKPGFLASKFVAGKRLLYLHPAQMYLFVTIIFFFLFSFIQRKQVENFDKKFAKKIEANTDKSITYEQLKDSIELKKEMLEDSIAKAELKKALLNTQELTNLSEEKIDSIAIDATNKTKSPISFSFNEAEIDSLIVKNASDKEIYKSMGMDDDDNWFSKRMYAQALKFYKSRRGGSILQAFFDTIPIAMFFLLPIFAFMLKLFYWKRGLYAHHLVFSFYFFSFLFATFSIMLAVNFVFLLPTGTNLLIALSTFIYLVIALKYFYKQGKFVSFVKGSVLTFLFMSIVIPATVVVLGLFSFLFY